MHSQVFEWSTSLGYVSFYMCIWARGSVIGVYLGPLSLVKKLSFHLFGWRGENPPYRPLTRAWGRVYLEKRVRVDLSRHLHNSPAICCNRGAMNVLGLPLGINSRSLVLCLFDGSIFFLMFSFRRSLSALLWCISESGQLVVIIEFSTHCTSLSPTNSCLRLVTTSCKLVWRIFSCGSW